MIYFNKPPIVGTEVDFLSDAIAAGELSGGGGYSKKCHLWFEARIQCPVLLTPSCTHALEMAAILVDIQPGDEVIMPSYTFVSTANAFVLRGAKIVFVDIRPDTMNINERLIEAAITRRTKAIVPVHYAGVACEMNVIMDIASRHQLFVIEDAAQGMMSTYQGRPLGTIGHLGAYSFHETKNYTSGGEGGLLIVSDPRFLERAEIIREKGTNRGLFFRGMVDKYSWVDIGSSYLLSDLQAAFLFAQLEVADTINDFRLRVWKRYYQNLVALKNRGNIELPVVPAHCEHNAHMFYIKTKDLHERTHLIEFLRGKEIMAVFHYVPLHQSVAGKEYGRFCGQDDCTVKESERLVRLPLWFGMADEDVDAVVAALVDFYS